jgi:hypothetical protein
MSDRPTFRPGDLAGPLAAYCESNGCTASEAMRRALAAMLGVEAPSMQRGNPKIAKQAKAAAAARWNSKRCKQKPNTQDQRQRLDG